MNFDQNFETTSGPLSFSPSLHSACTRPVMERRRMCSPTSHLTTHQYIRLLSMIDEVGGIATLDEISRALPIVQQPVSAVADLCDADILCADWESAFGADMRIWRAWR